MVRIESMSVVVSIAEAGSLSAASQKLRMPVPTDRRTPQRPARGFHNSYNRQNALNLFCAHPGKKPVSSFPGFARGGGRHGSDSGGGGFDRRYAGRPVD